MDLKTVAVFFVLINGFASIAMMLDKYYAVKKKWRLSEAFLLSFSFLGGGVGLAIGMLAFRHKLSKLKFRVIVPLGICLYMTLFFYLIWIEKIVLL